MAANRASAPNTPMALVDKRRSPGDRRRLLRQRPMESFWGLMQVELLDRKSWQTNLELAIAMADYIEHFYNPARRHTSLGHSPTPGHVVLRRGPPSGVQAMRWR